MSWRFTILGCGSSGGVPRVGSGWGKCDPADPRNRRRRCSLLVERIGTGGVTRVLIDTGPDLRDQLLGAAIEHLDGVLLTHDHADHTHGIDDLRPLVIHMRRLIDIHSDERTAHVLRERFGYCFQTPEGSDYPPMAHDKRLLAGHATVIDGAGGPIEATPFDVRHGWIDALGFRIAGMAYTPDVNAIPDSALPHLTGLDLWIIDALRMTPHPTHFNLDEALGWVARMQPKRAVLTNLHSDLDYAQLATSLPSGIEPAYDGLCLTLENQ
jgi:phosphoribosyl 1,2-cyclic phosphate phosphodiesterase